MMAFQLVDLDAQATQVAKYVKGWPTATVLEWLTQFGDVVPQHAESGVYTFHSRSGISTAFVLRENGEFLIIYDHTTRQVSSD